jgi:hypothetical protein
MWQLSSWLFRALLALRLVKGSLVCYATLTAMEIGIATVQDEDGCGPVNDVVEATLIWRARASRPVAGQGP